MERINKLLHSMFEFEKGNPRHIQHSLKVHGFARLIGENDAGGTGL